MTRAWRILAHHESAAGALELRQRGADDFLITRGGRVLMNSRAQRSEIALAEAPCAPLHATPQARVLVGGLGMGITLRAALDVLPADAEVTVAEIEPIVAEWCKGALAAVNRNALADPRVRLRLCDVADLITEAKEPFDAILLDLFEGPHARTPSDDPIYGSAALARTRAALRPSGIVAFWSESLDRSFERRLRQAGFDVERTRPGRGALRHAVYLARRSPER